MEYIKKIKLDFNAEQNAKTISVKQLDRNSRFLLIVPQLDNDKIDVRDCTVKLYIEKPDKAVIVGDGEVTVDGEIYVEITDIMTDIDGVARCDIKLFYEDSLLSSCVFYLKIVKSVSVSNIIHIYRNRAYAAKIVIEKGSSSYKLSSGEKLIFGVKKNTNQDYVIKKELSADDILEDEQGYMLLLTSDETNISVGTYIYDIALRDTNGQLVKVIAATQLHILESVVGSDA